jgi:ElaB/YqjD/DUF883 family membrane-anchored ribosome-binding protein
MGKKIVKQKPKPSHSILLSPKKFRKHFDRLAPLILQEWQHLELDNLTATEGDLDLVIDYIAEQTEQTRTRIQRHLLELYQLAKSEKDNQVKQVQNIKQVQNKVETVQAAAAASVTDLVELQEQIVPNIEKTLSLLEKRAEALLSQVDQEIIPDVKERVREKPGTSLLTALGIGFLIGLIVGGTRRGSR